jgi:hypothetical protein
MPRSSASGCRVSGDVAARDAARRLSYVRGTLSCRVASPRSARSVARVGAGAGCGARVQNPQRRSRPTRVECRRRRFPTASSVLHLPQQEMRRTAAPRAGRFPNDIELKRRAPLVPDCHGADNRDGCTWRGGRWRSKSRISCAGVPRRKCATGERGVHGLCRRLERPQEVLLCALQPHQPHFKAMARNRSAAAASGTLKERRTMTDSQKVTSASLRRRRAGWR